MESGVIRPLHVQVAEALDLWMHCSYEPPQNSMNLDDKGRWVGYNPKTMLVGERGTVPRYDTDWSATGPLIEKLKISVLVGKNGATAVAEDPSYAFADARGVLHSICRLILLLKEAGKL